VSREPRHDHDVGPRIALVACGGERRDRTPAALLDAGVGAAGLDVRLAEPGAQLARRLEQTVVTAAASHGPEACRLAPLGQLRHPGPCPLDIGVQAEGDQEPW
jgi:hypothetical protein